ncbi:MAG TPA: RNA polymerase sigma factor, partial [Solirubrobacteraceae bacterium]|nr:RNA polymerase sigma factor [Solirubrobacteraceae bacterium]
EVFVRAFRRRSAYEPAHATALPWLLGIASNLVGEHRRDERRRLVMLGRLGGGAPEIVEHGLGGLAPELVRELRKLSSAERDTLLLVVWGELSYEEAAFALEIPLGTVRSRPAFAQTQEPTGLQFDAARQRRYSQGCAVLITMRMPAGSLRQLDVWINQKNAPPLPRGRGEPTPASYH